MPDEYLGAVTELSLLRGHQLQNKCWLADNQHVLPWSTAQELIDQDVKTTDLQIIDLEIVPARGMVMRIELNRCALGGCLLLTALAAFNAASAMAYCLGDSLLLCFRSSGIQSWPLAPAGSGAAGGIIARQSDIGAACDLGPCSRCNQKDEVFATFASMKRGWGASLSTGWIRWCISRDGWRGFPAPVASRLLIWENKKVLIKLRMKIDKQRKKLLRAQEAAQECTTREQALKILRKAEKATMKLDSAGASVRD